MPLSGPIMVFLFVLIGHFSTPNGRLVMRRGCDPGGEPRSLGRGCLPGTGEPTQGIVSLFTHPSVLSLAISPIPLH
ncbi:hypothetical protein EV363DRAFT_1371173 [Boletus edulis]|uniref:Secreted protein n=1 Tax=Boletus edulis BED1 TaxID=1328754 RepID=A0AAD4BDU5_BOLED|nr:hypothetical protein EV363DRAFT_1371173 [Boletus edulis]KAF8420761.1 hypothetical protein L210DRAFT_3574214 [Boletus edulis BED1]